MKKCKHCQTELPKKAKVCPNCFKKNSNVNGCLTSCLFFLFTVCIIFVVVITQLDSFSINKPDFEINKQELEEHITTTVGLKNPKFSIVNYRSWDDGAGFTVVENTFEVDDIEHTYIARIGRDGVIYKLIIDDEVIIKANADQLMEYRAKYPEE